MARVVIFKCKNYQPDELKTKIENIFSYFPHAVQRGEKILLKPNLLSAHLPEEAVTTHPEFVRAVVRILKKIGAQPVIGDSPSIVEKIEKVWDMTGIKKVAQEEKIELINFISGGVKEFPRYAPERCIPSKNLSGKRIIRDEKSRGGPRPFTGWEKIYLSDIVFEVEGIISLPKLKTHNLMTFTAGIKNLYGLVPGMVKTDYHRLAYNSILFAQLLSEILAIVKPRLTIIDGIVGMDGNGPVAGRIRNFGLILASDDVVALDTVVCKLIGLKIEKVPLLKFCAEKKLGETNLEKIEIIGEKEVITSEVITSVEDYIIDDFLLPATEIVNYIPQWLAHILTRFVWTKPVIQINKCQLCMKCSEICPVGAIVSSSSKGKKKILQIDQKKCISCFCCSEACPHNAVEPQTSLLLKLIRAVR